MTALHLSSRRELSEALPTDDTEIQSHISAEKFRRKITVKVSDKVTSPLTYGIVNPVIILPKDLPADSEEMRFALAHELVHIRRFDVLMKLVLPPLRAFIGSILWLGQCSRLQIRILSFPAMKRC